MTDRQKITWGFGLWGILACVGGRAFVDGHVLVGLVLFGLSCWAHHRASELLRGMEGGQ